MNRRVIVYRDQLLPISETFVYNQALRLNRYEAFILGANRPAGLGIPLPEERVYLVDQGGKRGWLRRAGFKVCGWVPPDVLSWAHEVRPCLIHAHFSPDGAVAMPLARRLGVPLVVSLLGTDVTMDEKEVVLRSYPTHRLYVLRKQRLWQAASLFIVPSEFLRAKALERGYPPEKLRLVSHGIDLSEFRPDPSQVTEHRVLYVGRLIPSKGLPYLLHALAPLAPEFRGLRLVVIGHGPMRQEYEALAWELLGERVEFMGAQPSAVVRKEMQRAYVFSMPSVEMPSGEAETFGLVYVEAQAAGAPVVAFLSGGVPEVVRHGETGFLAPQRDTEGLRHSIRQLLEHPELRNRIAVNAREWVEQRFDLMIQNRLLESTYDELCQARMKEES
jgi:glycosyltransferase involved in cell wall biosynthesis